MRSCLLVFFIIIFVLTLPVFFFIINIGQTLTPAFIQKKLVSSGAIDGISKSLPGDLATAFSSDGSLNKGLIEDQIAKIPSTEIQSTLQSNVDKNLVAIADQNSKELVFDISNVTKTLPSEAREQIAQQSGQPIKDIYTYPIPFQFRFYRYLVNNLALFKIAGLCFIGSFLIFITLLANSWRTKLRAISISLLIPGLSMLVPALALRLTSINIPKLAEIPQFISLIVSELVNVIKLDIANLYIWEGLVILGTSIVVFVFSFYVSGESQNASVIQKPEPAQA